MSLSEKRATINDVARSAGVSIKTVSRVFNKEPNVRAATKEKVLTAANELNYRPNLSARRLASNRSFVIGMLYENPNPDYVTEIQYGALKACRHHDYNLLIHPCKADASTLIDEILGIHHQATVDGFIILQPLSDREDLNLKLIENNIPCVRISQQPYPGLPWVSVGDEQAADNMTTHLLSLGHKRIGFIMGHPEHSSSQARLKGYRNALIRKGLEYDSSLNVQGFFDYDSGYIGCKKLLDLEEKPTAIFASNDLMAMGALAAAHEKGLSVPTDLSIAGFDDISMAKFVWPPLTTMHQPIALMAEHATEILLQQLSGVTPQESSHCFEAQLICRESTANP